MSKRCRYHDGRLKKRTVCPRMHRKTVILLLPFKVAKSTAWQPRPRGRGL
jgi:hypothetical protein